MGKVFSFEEIQQGHIPTLSKNGAEPIEFSAASIEFGKAVHRGIEAGSISGAMVFGSVAVAMAGIRSDFDCVITTLDGSRQNMNAAVYIVEQVERASGNKIPIQPIMRPIDSLQSGTHELDRFFGLHLSGPHRLVYGTDPGEIIQYNNVPAMDVMKDFITAKVRKLSDALTTHDSQDKLRAYQRMLELPLAVGRKALRVVDDVEGTHRSVENSASKMEVRTASLKLFQELDLAKQMRELVQVDAFYNDILERTIEGKVSKQVYSDFLNGINDELIPTIAWLINFYNSMEVRLKPDGKL